MCDGIQCYVYNCDEIAEISIGEEENDNTIWLCGDCYNRITWVVRRKVKSLRKELNKEE